MISIKISFRNRVNRRGSIDRNVLSKAFGVIIELCSRQDTQSVVSEHPQSYRVIRHSIPSRVFVVLFYRSTGITLLCRVSEVAVSHRILETA